MPFLTMLDRSQAPTVPKARKALEIASKAAKTPLPGAWAFYLGGPAHNKGKGSTYTNDVLDGMAGHGILLLPIFVGIQGNLSHARGVSDAKAAMKLNKTFRSRNDMLVADIERHTSDADPQAAVRYVEGWTETLHAAGLRSMAYGSFNLAIDLGKSASPQPDAIWVARFVATKPEPGHDPHVIKGVPDSSFKKRGRRAHQYGGAAGNVACTVNGLNVDVSIVDSEIFGAAGGHAAAPPTGLPPKKGAKAVTPPAPPVVGGPRPKTVTIKPGDTLTQLAARVGVSVASLLNTNRAILDAAAQAHGHPDCDKGNLIFPGVVITVP